MKTLRMILVIIAVLGAIKSVIAVIWPGLAQRTVNWWLALPAAMGRVIGAVLAVFGLLMVGLAIAQTGNPVIGAVVLVGAFATAWGLAYQYPRVWHGMLRPFSTSGQAWVLRVVAVVILLVCGALLFIGLKGWGN